jgi:hypothetical protein
MCTADINLVVNTKQEAARANDAAAWKFGRLHGNMNFRKILSQAQAQIVAS